MTAPLTAPYTYVDVPTPYTFNAPPALPTFVDGALVHQGDLNALSANLNYLYAYVLGGQTATKPLTILRQTTPQSFTTAVATVVNWDTADKNTDSAWSAGTPGAVYIQTAGIYRIYYQGGHASTASASTLFILVNGTDIVNNCVANSTWNGNLANVEITTPLAAGASVQAVLLQTTGSTKSSSTTFGGQRFELEWLCP